MILSFLLGWWQRCYAAIIKWVLIAAGLLLVLLQIRLSGRNDERTAQFIKQNEIIGRANEVENDIRRLRSGDAIDKLRRYWTRK